MWQLSFRNWRAEKGGRAPGLHSRLGKCRDGGLAPAAVSSPLVGLRTRRGGQAWLCHPGRGPQLQSKIQQKLSMFSLSRGRDQPPILDPC